VPAGLRSDWLKRLVFELGAGWYARKLATGPEAELRSEFADWLGVPPGAALLDVGCGPGHLARELARCGARVTGVDRGWRLLRIARRLAAREGLAVEFRRAAAERLPFPEHAFDFVLATTVVYFVRRPGAVLAEMARVARPGGAVASLDPSNQMTAAAVAEYARRRGLDRRDTRKLVLWARAAELSNRRFTEADLRGLLAGAGLEQIRLERRLDGMVWFSRGVKPAGASRASNAGMLPEARSTDSGGTGADR
jgi:ubiquinone/menaquinone biosynthesis C-methylase UbiE